MPSQNYQLTPEQLAISQERKRRKAEAAQTLSSSDKVLGDDERFPISKRRWLTRETNPSRPSECIASGTAHTVMTWNMLAQCLVRRELFPTSDCLKASQRNGMLHCEIQRSKADILCLQEVDQLDSLLPILESAGYSHVYSCGPRKKHGCVVAYRTASYEKLGEHSVFYDDAEVRLGGSDNVDKRGASFKTRNIGLLVALRHINAQETLVIATTHLFWHPRYTYERARQAYILARSVREFKIQRGLFSSSSIIAGDFNCTPSDPAYSLLVGDPLLPDQKTAISISRVVHVSVDPSVPLSDPKKAANEEEGGEVQPEEDPDRVITNARAAKPEDGLLDPDELELLFKDGSTEEALCSAYDEWPSSEAENIFGSRVTIPEGRKGAREPAYTSYTHFWKSTLDYIFASPTNGKILEVLSILEPPSKGDLDPGLPRKGVSGSDHISLCTRIAFADITSSDDQGAGL